MQQENELSIERIIAKVDNDFNPDNSDWIPRAAAWTIDALAILNATKKVKKDIRLRVDDRIVYSNRPLDLNNLELTDCNGCTINRAKSGCGNGFTSSTGKVIRSVTPKTIDLMEVDNKAPFDTIAETVNTKDYPSRYNVKNVNYREFKKEYIVIDERQLYLNFDADSVTATTYDIETRYSDLFQEDLPIIPNVGSLLEGITNYIMYKMLTRGYKHPVMNLAASQYGTNPYFMWNTNKDRIKNDVIKHYQGEVIKGSLLWNGAFYISTFNPRNK